MHYDDWALSYDSDMKGWDYLAPGRVADSLRGFMVDRTSALRCLDVGIGTGLLSEELHRIRSDLEIFGVDISARMLALCRRKGRFRKLRRVDVGRDRLPFPDESFDIVASSGVMESVGGIGHAIGEMARVLKPGGMMVFTYVPGTGHPLGNAQTRALRPGRTTDGRFVMGPMTLHAHNPLKVRTYAALSGVKPLPPVRFTGYRTYVVVTVDYELFVGQKRL
ncbi:MAG: methyltransferase domain-containing protein [Alphaproteobacteria bacterium]|nr:methyltransferase domain-containing protein [Alphaproteobacteria bacterium]